MNVITNKISMELMTAPEELPKIHAVQGETNTRTQISEKSGVSLQKIDRSLTILTEYGLIKREGSKKKGRYVVDMPIDKRASCASCKLKNKCEYTGAETGNCARFR